MIKELKQYAIVLFKKIVVLKRDVQDEASFEDSKEWIQKNNEVTSAKTDFETNVLNKIKTK